MNQRDTTCLASPLNATDSFVGMDGPEQGEICEHCGSPLDENGLCWSCTAGGFADGGGYAGAAPLDRRELSKVLGRSVGSRAHGSYSLSMQQDERMAPLRKQIELLTERFNASPEVKASVRQSAERTAVKIVDDLGPTKAAIASVAQEFIRRGRTVAEVVSCIASVHQGMDRLKDLIVEVCPTAEGEIRVLVDGRNRPFRSYSGGIYRKLRIPLFASDGSAIFELKSASLTEGGYDEKRVEPRGSSEFIVKADERSFELFKVLEEARLSEAGLLGGGTDIVAILRKYSISKLPFTQSLLREVGLLQYVNSEYARTLAEKVKDGKGRSPRKLAEDSLKEACRREVPSCLEKALVQKYHLRESAMASLIVNSELEAHWR